jgi:hypothetical protein
MRHQGSSVSFPVRLQSSSPEVARAFPVYPEEREEHLPAKPKPQQVSNHHPVDPNNFRHSLPRQPMVFLICNNVPDFKEPTMEWTTPQHEEIDLNCEISSYANAEL